MRKTIITFMMVLLWAGLFSLTGCGDAGKENEKVTAEEKVYQRAEVVKSAAEAQKLLEEGNKRYTSGQSLKQDLSAAKRDKLATKGQQPFAVVVTCSDSRVPAELLFDQGLGDIFVVRVAGNVMDQVALGSVEYGVEHLKTPLLVVLGHEKCGAVKATVDGGEAPGSIGAIVAKIKPAVEKAKAAGATGNELYEKATDENIKATVADIEKSPIVEELVHEGHLKIVGAKYFLTTGEVKFIEE